MKVLKFETANRLYMQLAEKLIQQVEAKPTTVLGLATGRTFIPFYATLVKLAQKRHVSFREVITFNLDEYMGIFLNHENSFHTYMQTHLFSQLGFNLEHTFFPKTHTSVTSDDLESYESLIKKFGGIDIQLLGLGKNGHIGFNEPGSPFDSRTRIVTLSESTRLHNAGAFAGENFPTQAVTMGLATIFGARSIELVVTGKEKAEILHRCLQKTDPQYPASILLNHPNCQIWLDEAAASYLI